jgi:hypothetical protein
MEESFLLMQGQGVLQRMLAIEIEAIRAIHFINTI